MGNINGEESRKSTRKFAQIHENTKIGEIREITELGQYGTGSLLERRVVSEIIKEQVQGGWKNTEMRNFIITIQI